MKNVLCKHCELTCKRIGLIECDKYASFDYEEALKEYKRLLISKDDNIRLEKLKTRIQNINGGTI